MTTERAGGPCSLWAGRRVLVLSPTPTFPIDFGNRRRIFFVCRRLQSLGASIVFVHYPAEADWRSSLPRPAQREMVAQWDDYYVVPPTRPLHSAPKAGHHHGADDWWDPAIGDMLGWIFATQAIDVLLVNYTWLSKAFTFAPDHVVKILDTHDKFSGRRELLLAHAIEPEFFYTTEPQEQLAFGRADLIWAIKGQEEQSFQALTDRDVLTLLHAEPSRPATFRRTPALLRFGLFGARNNINRTNFRRFIETAHRYIRKTLMPCELVVAGTCCADLDDIDLPFLRKLGRVADVAKFYDSVDVVLGAIEFSTGLKIKIGEALSYGKPVIAHEHCFEGYIASHPFHALPSFCDMLRACRQVVRRPEMLQELEAASQRALHAADRSVATALEVSLSPERTIRRSIVIVADAADMQSGNWVFDHVREAAEYLRFQVRVTTYLLGTAPPGAVLPLADLAAFGDVILESTSAGDGAGAGQRTRHIIASMTFGAVVAAHPLGVWFAAIPSRLPHDETYPGMAAWAHLGPLTVRRTERDALAGLRRLAVAFPKLRVADTEHSALLAQSAGFAASTRVSPILWRGHTSATVAAARRHERRGVVILAAAAGIPYLAAVVAAARLTTRRPLTIVVDDRSHTDLPVATGSMGVTDIVSFSHALGNTDTGAFVLFQIGESSCFAGLREVFHRGGTPVIRLFASGHAPLSDEAAGENRRSNPAGSLLWMVTLLREEWRIAAIRRREAENETYANDAGWTLVWDEVRSLTLGAR